MPIDSKGDPCACRTCEHSTDDVVSMSVAVGKWLGKCRKKEPVIFAVPVQVRPGLLGCQSFTNWVTVEEGDRCPDHVRDPKKPYVAPKIDGMAGKLIV